MCSRRSLAEIESASKIGVARVGSAPFGNSSWAHGGHATGEHSGAIAFAAPAMWFLVFGFLGVFLRYLDKPSARWRYLLDASYWMYIVHPPVVMVLPALLADVPLPTMVKFILVVGVATALILLVYHYAVRPTFIGAQLNGKRYPRSLPGRPTAS